MCLEIGSQTHQEPSTSHHGSGGKEWATYLYDQDKRP